jgi:selenide,water dikinase
LYGIKFPIDENVLVGLERADDAGVYRISDSLALIQTVDFFTPVVDDPYWFGQIAAANALSDVYAMGGIPKTAMNLVGFPLRQMDIGVLRRIIQGGIDKLQEAQVVLIGGHSVEDHELKYGLAVTGFVHPDRLLIKPNLKPGDVLVLTKPLGSGVINTAIKGDLASPGLIERIIGIMAALNRNAAEVMASYPVHACTDITGFGLLGHIAEMVIGSGCSLLIRSGQVPILPEALEFAAMGFLPAGAHKNKSFRMPMVSFADTVDAVMQDVLFDPQTSGGLLISIARDRAGDLVSELIRKGVVEATSIGEVIADPAERIMVS